MLISESSLNFTIRFKFGKVLKLFFDKFIISSYFACIFDEFDTFRQILLRIFVDFHILDKVEIDVSIMLKICVLSCFSSELTIVFPESRSLNHFTRPNLRFNS